MSVLLGTNACIAAINGRPERVRERITRFVVNNGPVSVSTVAVLELRYGVAKSQQVARNTMRLDRFLASVLVLAFEADDARIAGDLLLGLEQAGRTTS